MDACNLYPQARLCRIYTVFKLPREFVLVNLLLFDFVETESISLRLSALLHVEISLIIWIK